VIVEYILVVAVVVDMIGKRNLRTRAIKMLILDEANEMLNKGNISHFFLTIPTCLSFILMPLHHLILITIVVHFTSHPLSLLLHQI